MDQALSAHAPLPWRHGFAELGPDFYAEVPLQPLPDVHWVAQNRALATELGLPPDWWDHPATLPALAGNQQLPGSRLLASAYAGHQFGVWAGRLGDGRAVLLGELPDGQGRFHEIQLKGAGLTPFSRSADGRAVLRSSIREYLCSEAMHALGVPTTRALALVGSSAAVYREQVESAAVVTRVAPSFVRFGHFEYLAFLHARTESAPYTGLRKLADWVLQHHYPERWSEQPNPYLALLDAVVERTSALLAQWQALGFCHGVMNTDNMSLLGLTLDYGPYQFLDGFDPGHICNHTDSHGRYAFKQQPQIGHWNLVCLARAMLPLLGQTEAVQACVDSFRPRFEQASLQAMRAKLGLQRRQAEDAALVESVLSLLAQERVDYSIFWRRLSHWVQQGGISPATNPQSDVRALFAQPAGIDAWLQRYHQRLSQDDADAGERMLRCNPAYVLRNYLAEQAIRQAEQGDFSEVERLQTLLARPFDEQPGMQAYAQFPPSWASGLSISCSS